MIEINSLRFFNMKRKIVHFVLNMKQGYKHGWMTTALFLSRHVNDDRVYQISFE